MPRIAIVGAGLRGRMFAHVLRDRATIVGFADPSAAVREGLDPDGPPIYADHRQLYEEQQPDAVIVATPDFAHRDPAVDAARSGAHLLIEKPLATTGEDARAIRDAVRQTGVYAMVGFENRWNPHFVAVRRARDEGGLGLPVSQHVTLSNTYAVPTRMLGWAGRSSPLWFLAPHALDLTLWQAGASPASVFARGHRGVLAARGIDTWDVVQLSLRLDDDSLVDISCAWILPESDPALVEGNYRILTTAGAARVDLRHQGLAVSDGSACTTPNPVEQEVDGEETGIAARMVRRFALDLGRVLGDRTGDGAGPGPTSELYATELPTAELQGEKGASPARTPDIDHGVLVTETLVAAERSMASETPVDLTATARGAPQ